MKTILHISGMSVTVDDSYSIVSGGFDWKKAAVDFAKAAGTAGLGMAAGMATTATRAAVKGESVDGSEIAESGYEGAQGMGEGAISSFIPD
jgi:hypothetical protein